MGVKIQNMRACMYMYVHRDYGGGTTRGARKRLRERNMQGISECRKKGRGGQGRRNVKRQDSKARLLFGVTCVRRWPSRTANLLRRESTHVDRNAYNSNDDNDDDDYGYNYNNSMNDDIYETTQLSQVPVGNESETDEELLRRQQELIRSKFFRVPAAKSEKNMHSNVEQINIRDRGQIYTAIDDDNRRNNVGASSSSHADVDASSNLIGTTTSGRNRKGRRASSNSNLFVGLSWGMLLDPSQGTRELDPALIDQYIITSASYRFISKLATDLRAIEPDTCYSEVAIESRNEILNNFIMYAKQRANLDSRSFSQRHESFNNFESKSDNYVSAQDFVFSSEIPKPSLTEDSSLTAFDEPVLVDVSQVAGIMIIMQQQNLCQEAIAFGKKVIGMESQSLKAHLTLERDIRVSMALCCCSLAENLFVERKISVGCEYLNEASYLIRSFPNYYTQSDQSGHSGERNAFWIRATNDLLREIEDGIETMLPECCLEHLSISMESDGDGRNENNEVRRGAVDTLRFLIVQDIEEVQNDYYMKKYKFGSDKSFGSKLHINEIDGSQRQNEHLLSASFINDALKQLTSTELMMMTQQSFVTFLDKPMLTRQWPGFIKQCIYAHIAHGYYYRDYDDIVKAAALLEKYGKSAGQNVLVERSLIQVLLGDMDQAEKILLSDDTTTVHGTDEFHSFADFEAYDNDSIPVSVASDMIIQQKASGSRGNDAEALSTMNQESLLASNKNFVLATSMTNSSTNITYGDAIIMVLENRQRYGDSISAFVELTENWLTTSVLNRFRDTLNQKADHAMSRAETNAPWTATMRKRRTTTSLVDYFDSPWIRSMATVRSASLPKDSISINPIETFHSYFYRLGAKAMYKILSMLSNSFLRSDVKRFAGFQLQANKRRQNWIATLLARLLVSIAAVLLVGRLLLLSLSNSTNNSLVNLATTMTTMTTSVSNTVINASRTIFTDHSPLRQAHESPSGKKVQLASPQQQGSREPSKLPRAHPRKVIDNKGRYLTTREGYALIQQWQLIKSIALGERHNYKLLKTILCDNMLQQWYNFSVEASKEGWHWIYDLKGIAIKNVRAILHKDGKGKPSEYIIVAVINEGAKVVENGSVTQSYDSPYRVVYRVKCCADGVWRISRGELQQ